jgi:hypothetical protein
LEKHSIWSNFLLFIIKVQGFPLSKKTYQLSDWKLSNPLLSYIIGNILHVTLNIFHDKLICHLHTMSSKSITGIHKNNRKTEKNYVLIFLQIPQKMVTSVHT